MPTQRDSLIAAIRETPDDDDVRRVCADWFEDQGDEASLARAEFIRVQLQRASLPLSDPQHSELQARELRLVKRWGRVWCPQHFFRKVTFRRGFVERVHLHLKHFLHHRRQMLAMEPVREIRLTGWGGGRRDLPNLVHRVAGCEEWAEIETLAIHHQGPHKDPGNVLTLLESPHFAGLRGLHCPRLSLDAETRRRFERLPFLRRLRDLHFPTLETMLRQPPAPGDWFSDGVPIQPWEGLTSLRLDGTSAGMVRRLLAMPFWPCLTSLVASVQYGQGADVVRLDEHLPGSLRELSLFGGMMGAPGRPALIERLRRMPLRRLYLGLSEIDSALFDRLFDGTGNLELRELSLADVILNDYAPSLGRAPGLRTLHTLALSGGTDRHPEAMIPALLASDGLPNLTHLDLGRSQTSPAEVRMLASPKGWNRLRILTLATRDVTAEDLLLLLRSPNLQGVSILTVQGFAIHAAAPGLDLTVELARTLTRLPHLARLDLKVRHCDPQARQILMECPTLAWPQIETLEDRDSASYRANRSPERTPPVDLK
jgi:uncharacterized protein (TIGR02996 family)